MMNEPFPKIRSIQHLYDMLPEHERVMVDVLRNIVKDHLPEYCKEKISYNVPYFHGNRGICIIWPSAIPRGGIKSGVLLGFWYGHLLKDDEQYLDHGTNKQIYYKIFQSVEDIDVRAITPLLNEAVELDERSSHKRK